MLLERHFDPKRPVNIHELSVEAPERATFDIQREFEALKKSSFYDQGENRWYLGIDSEQKPAQGIAAGRCATELLALCVEAMFNKELAQRRYNQLQETTLYDRDTQRWEEDFSHALHPHRWHTKDQLLSILLELNFNKDSARERYRRLKEALFNKNTQHWYSGYYRFQRHEESVSETFSPYTDLLGILVESFFDKEQAKRSYDSLKESNFYVVKLGGNSFWAWYIHSDGDRSDYDIAAGEQLMGFWVYAQFDKEDAQKEYAALKKTKLFDRGKKQWMVIKSTLSDHPGSNNTDRSSHNQFLDLLIQNALMDKEVQFESKTPPTPESRKF